MEPSIPTSRKPCQRFKQRWSSALWIKCLLSSMKASYLSFFLAWVSADLVTNRLATWNCPSALKKWSSSFWYELLTKLVRRQIRAENGSLRLRIKAFGLVLWREEKSSEYRTFFNDLTILAQHFESRFHAYTVEISEFFGHKSLLFN